jgi:hypothetical protein
VVDACLRCGILAISRALPQAPSKLADLVAHLLLTTLPIAIILPDPVTQLHNSFSSPKSPGTSVILPEITRVAEATQPQCSCTLHAAVKVP